MSMQRADDFILTMISKKRDSNGLKQQSTVVTGGSAEGSEMCDALTAEILSTKN